MSSTLTCNFYADTFYKLANSNIFYLSIAIFHICEFPTIIISEFYHKIKSVY